MFARHAAAVALEQAHVDSAQPERVATVVGCSKGRLYAMAAANPPLFDPQEFPGETVSRDIAVIHKFCGPVLNYPAACATGLACVIAAANLLRDDLCDLAITGSAEASAFPLTLSSFANMGALSTRVMRPFHRERDGFNPAEGAGVLVLERESSSRARGHQAIARLAGFDIRSDAHHITSPEASGATIALSIRRTLRMAGWSLADVQYINAHGTGTRQNDDIEARAIYSIFGENCPPVSSLKSYLGHLLGGSAGAELVTAIVSLCSGFIPPTHGLDQLDPAIAPLNHVPQRGLATHVRRILKLSLGFGGHIACAAVELL